MALQICVLDEEGDLVNEMWDYDNVLTQKIDHLQYSPKLLQYVDIYANTVFNRLQLLDFVLDIESIIKISKNEKEIKILNDIKNLCLQCINDKHRNLYLKIIGD